MTLSDQEIEQIEAEVREIQRLTKAQDYQHKQHLICPILEPKKDAENAFIR